MRREVVDVLNSMPERNRLILGVVSRIGQKQVPLLYDQAHALRAKRVTDLRWVVRDRCDYRIFHSAFTFQYARRLLILTIGCSARHLCGLFCNVRQLVKGWASVLLAFLSFNSVQLFDKRCPLYVIAVGLNAAVTHPSHAS
jgi:hypothetical protein